MPQCRRVGRRSTSEPLTLSPATTRGGRRIPWSELSLRRRVNAARPDEVLGYDLLHADGTEIRLAAGALVDGQAAVRYALERMGA